MSAPSPADDWSHLLQYGYAPGHYMSHCHRCEQVVSGLDKRAITCLPCAKLRHAEALHDCPHADPRRYCAECPVNPCPIGLGAAITKFESRGKLRHGAMTETPDAAELERLQRSIETGGFA